ncbi:MAG: response regulator, partial [Rhodobacterales bacterium]|nr:response regulator [Rhodobacterales bacterium]
AVLAAIDLAQQATEQLQAGETVSGGPAYDDVILALEACASEPSDAPAPADQAQGGARQNAARDDGAFQDRTSQDPTPPAEAPAAPPASAPKNGKRVAPVAPNEESGAQAPIVPSPGASNAEKLVRIRADKLDGLLTSFGELLVARQRIKGRDDELAEMRDFLRTWQKSWTAAVRPLRDLAAQVPRAAALVETCDSNLNHLAAQTDTLVKGLSRDRGLVEAAVSSVERDIRRLRLLPFEHACVGFDRSVRDIARDQGKRVAFTLVGGRTEVDRSVIDFIREPLLHLIRNAVNHGIETAEDRRRAGKAEEGRLTLSVGTEGQSLVVALRDDGRGLDQDAIIRAAEAKGLDTSVDPAMLIFAPGMSTADGVTEVAGRGMGLDIVKKTIETHRGTLAVTSEPGAGTCFTIHLPLTLATIKAILVRVNGQILALDSTPVTTMMRVERQAVRMLDGRETLCLDDTPVSIVRLGGVLDPGLAQADDGDDDTLSVVVLSAGGLRAAFAVDELVAEQDILLKDLGPRLRGTPFVRGVTLLTDGTVSPVLSASELVAHALGLGGAAGAEASVAALRTETAAAGKVRLLIADDSVTTRTLEASILEQEGFEVRTAADGQEAWSMIQQSPPDLLISDFEMPRMNGIELTRTIRGSSRHRALPVILVTGRGKPEDRARGLEAGANAYLVKSRFDQTVLVDTVRQLL